MKSSPARGWVLYDDSCGFCRRWIPFWASTLLRRGYQIAPLQSAWVREHFKIPDDDLIHDLRLLLVDNTQLQGADVYRHVMRQIWWAYPLFLLASAPLFRDVFDRGYRTFANNRFRFSRACGLAASPPMEEPSPIFLTGEWRYLVMLNYAVDQRMLRPLVPRGTELDFFENQTFLSVVGFRFLRTRVFGLSFPLHGAFEEVNLRFYVRRKTDAGWRRGVVFIRELVPRRAVALVARLAYGEPYVALPMRHAIDRSDAGIRVQYAWKRAGQWESLQAAAAGQPEDIKSGSEEEFITEHYWGYTTRKTGSSEYQVDHPRWRVWHCDEFSLNADIAGLYGERFVESLAAAPSSAFIADGSPIAVHRGKPFSTITNED